MKINSTRNSLIACGIITVAVGLVAVGWATQSDGQLTAEINTNIPAGNFSGRLADAIEQILTSNDSAVVLSGVPSGSVEISTPAPLSVSFQVR